MATEQMRFLMPVAGHVLQKRNDNDEIRGEFEHV
jgi:hypothetical protein